MFILSDLQFTVAQHTHAHPAHTRTRHTHRVRDLYFNLLWFTTHTGTPAQHTPPLAVVDSPQVTDFGGVFNSGELDKVPGEEACAETFNLLCLTVALLSSLSA